jgi:hypothetical protein
LRSDARDLAAVLDVPPAWLSTRAPVAEQGMSRAYTGQDENGEKVRCDTPEGRSEGGISTPRAMYFVQPTVKK